MAETMREKVIRLIREMRNRTVENGCTPAEAAAFAAKVAEWVEKYQVEEAELAGAGGKAAGPKFDVDEDILRTGKRAFNPGVNQVVNALAESMACKCILLHKVYDGQKEAVYGITGDSVDTEYVCQVALSLLPALQLSAKLEGYEHGKEGGALQRWCNQYLTGAAVEIRARIVKERAERADVRRTEAALSGGALVVVTGEDLFAKKLGLVADAFKRKYPHTRTTRSSSGFDGEAFSRGREEGKRVGLHPTVSG